MISKGTDSPGSKAEPGSPAQYESLTSDLRFMAQFDFAVVYFLYCFSKLPNLYVASMSVQFFSLCLHQILRLC